MIAPHTHRNGTVTRIAIAVAATVAVLGAALDTAAPLAERPAPINGSIAAVGIIEESMVAMRQDATSFRCSDYLRIACTLEGLDPWLVVAFDQLADDPVFAKTVREWRAAYWDGLVYCARGDFTGANGGLADAYRSLEALKAGTR